MYATVAVLASQCNFKDSPVHSSVIAEIRSKIPLLGKYTLCQPPLWPDKSRLIIDLSDT